MAADDVAAFRARIERLPPGNAVPWFLDIDGVLNLTGNRPRGGWPRYANLVIPQGYAGLAWPVCYAPALVGLLNLLHQRRIVSFRWLTTWEHLGPQVFAPAVGLDLGEWVAAEDPGISKGWWKLDAIVDYLSECEDGEFFIWTDDDMRNSKVVSLQDQGVIDMLPATVLALCTHERRGLTPENFAVILTAIEEAAWT